MLKSASRIPPLLSHSYSFSFVKFCTGFKIHVRSVLQAMHDAQWLWGQPHLVWAPLPPNVLGICFYYS